MLELFWVLFASTTWVSVPKISVTLRLAYLHEFYSSTWRLKISIKWPFASLTSANSLTRLGIYMTWPTKLPAAVLYRIRNNFAKTSTTCCLSSNYLKAKPGISINFRISIKIMTSHLMRCLKTIKLNKRGSITAYRIFKSFC